MRLSRALGALLVVASCIQPLIGTASATPLSASSQVVKALPVSDLKIMNYYPADAGWWDMWTGYSHDRTVADFRSIASLGANTVRIIVPPAAMGYPEVSPQRLGEFQDVLAVAAAQGLHVQLTLFDMWHNYSDVSGSMAWARSLLARQSNNPTLALVELQNEIPLTPAAADWARQLLPYLRVLLPQVPRTVSATGSSGPAGIKAVLLAFPPSLMDVGDVHYYGDAAGALNAINTALANSDGRPVIVGEAGLSTLTGAAGEEAQARFYRVLARTTHSLGIPPAAPWIFSDFAPNAIPYPTTQSQYHYGLRRISGTWKPAAAVVAASFAGRPSTDIDGSFERESNGDQTLGSWRLFDSVDGKAVVTTSVARTGKHAVCFNHTNGGLTAVPSVMQAFPVLESGQVVSASAYVFRHQATGAERVSLAWFDKSGRYLGQVESRWATGNDSWTPLSVSGRAPVAATVVQVHLKSAHETGTACYDDVSVSW